MFKCVTIIKKRESEARKPRKVKRMGANDGLMWGDGGWNAAMPAMYPTFVASCFMERVWRFALPLVVAQLHKSLLPVAVISFVGQVLPCSFLPLLLQRWWLCCFCFCKVQPCMAATFPPALWSTPGVLPGQLSLPSCTIPFFLWLLSASSAR